MATDKKSFLLYCDLIHTVSKMPNEKAGELFKHILEYVNDNNPSTEDLIIQLTFEPIKQSLKRDLEKYEQIRAKNSENATKRWHKNNATASDRMPTDAKHADSGIDNGIDSVKVNNIEERKLKFAATLKSYTETYGREMMLDFYKYWTEPNKSNTKYKQELEKTWSLDRRLETWAKNNSSFNKGNTPQHKEIIYEK
tara:strand:- start:16110 stop:16697 length:588 start_codon:yes stop_codon:yes gene_type:complete